MRWLGMAVLGVVVACGTTKEKAMEQPKMDAAAAPAPPPVPAAFPMAEAVGTWDYVAKAMNKDSVLVRGVLTATADPNGWTITLPNRKPMPMRVTVSGDSIMTATGPYESVLRKGVQVTTNGVMRMVNGKLVGPNMAHYKTNKSDSTMMMMIEGTRRP